MRKTADIIGDKRVSQASHTKIQYIPVVSRDIQEADWTEKIMDVIGRSTTALAIGFGIIVIIFQAGRLSGKW